MDTLIAFAVAAIIGAFFLRSYLKGLKKREEASRASAEKGKLFSHGPTSQHPHIDTTHCIGCATCTLVCPEGDVLAMIAAKAVIVNGYKCIGHSLCAEACPVGAITMVLSQASMGADMPRLTPEHETSVENMFIIGELGGLALIKNAVNQGRDCVDLIAGRLATNDRPLVDAVRWLVGEASFAGAETSEEDVRIETTKQQDLSWFYATIFGAPCLVLAAGVVLSRRSRRGVGAKR